MLVQEIDQLGENELSSINFHQWPTDVLADYIVNYHHTYIEQATPTIKNLLSKICMVHGDQHPELEKIQSIFNKTSGELAVHMKKEELMLFPYIKKLVLAEASGLPVNSKHFTSVDSPIQELNDDHLNEGEELAKMARLSNNFTPPADACLTYQTTYRMLKEYESDMHLHIHLENNVLFIKAKAIEEKLLRTSIQIR